MFKTLVLGTLPLAVLASACRREPTAAPTYRSALRTDQTTYFATPVSSPDSGSRSFNVILQYANESSSPIYLARCTGSSQPALGIQHVNSTGFSVEPTTQVAFACASDAPLSVTAGATRTDTFSVSAPTSLPADIRLFYLASACGSPMGACMPLLPDSDRVSATVRVLPAP